MKAHPKPTLPVAREGTGFVGSSGSRYGLLLVGILGALFLPTMIHAASGDLDTTFGTGGKVVTAVGAGEDRGHAVALQGDGKVVVAGYSHNGTNKDFCLVRYNADGTLDTGFGTGGKVVTDFGVTHDEINAVAVQSDGKIVTVGHTFTSGSNVVEMALARYNADGTPDTDFGVSGTGRMKPAIGLLSLNTKANGVTLQADGKIVIVGTALPTSSRYTFALLRYNTDGTLDDTFGTSGVVFIDFGSNVQGQDVAVQPDGRIVAAGIGSSTALLARCNTDGNLDVSLGGTGKVTTGSSGAHAMTAGYSIALQQNGKIMLGGLSYTNDYALRRHNADGTPDNGFSNTAVAGLVTTAIGTAQDLAYDIALQPDGRIVAAGFSYNADTGFNDFAVVRYLTDGSLDTSFKSTGKVLGGFTGGNAVGRSMVIAPDGGILVAGYARNGANDDLALMRLIGSGNLATTAPAHGSHTSNPQPVIRGTATAEFTVNVQIDGTVAGTAVADMNGNWSFSNPTPLADGLHTAAATETDGIGNTGPLSNAVSFTVDTAAPAAPVVTTPTEALLVSSAWPVISGTAEAGATVTVYIDGSAVGTAVASLAGNWSFTPNAALVNGLHTVRATAADAAGNTSLLSDPVGFSTLSALFGGPGTLDNAFGISGKVITPIGGSDDRGHAAARQSDGKIVVAGYSHSGSNKDFAVARYNADGTLDTSFGISGKVTTDFGSTNDEANGVAVQADGKIVVVGGAAVVASGQSSFALARYNTNGTLDTSFGLTGTGRLKPAIGALSGNTKATGVRVQSDGKIVVVGTSLTANLGYDFGYDIVVLRYNVDGTLDGGFGTGGLAIANIGQGDYGQDVQVLPDGRIVVGGYGVSGSVGGKLARFHGDGTLDTSFGGTGLVSVANEGEQYMTSCFRIALQADGKLVLAGASNNNDISLRRYNMDGTRDMSFGTGGVVTTPVGTASDLAYDVSVQDDGRIVVAGYAHNGNTGFTDFVLVRYQNSGNLDTSFDRDGKLTTSFPGGSAVGRCMSLASDGRIVVAGYAHDGSKNNFALAQYFGAGNLTTGAPIHGSQTNDSTPVISGRASAGFMVTVYLDGSIAGTTTADGEGVWTFTPSLPLGDGAHLAAVTETDGSGSTSPLSNAVTFTVDTAAPTPPVVTGPAESSLVDSAWPVISGTAEAGATVTVQVDGLTSGTVVASLGGNWSFTAASALTDGLHTARAAATDAAGNSSGFSDMVSFSTLTASFGGPGTLDTGFGVNGKIVTAVGSGDDRGHAVALQGDGKVVVAGYSHNGTNKDFAVVRYNADGTLDAGFGAGGKVTTDFGGTNDEANGVAVQADGRIIAVGGALSATNQQVFAIARYHANGLPDADFGLTGTGWFKTTIGSTSHETQARAVKVLADGKILVAGNALFGSADYVVLRYHPDGTLDDEFGAGGLAVAPLTHNEYARNMVLESTGHVMVSGYSYNSGYFYSLVGRFDPAGSYVSGFQIGLNGLSLYSYGAALQADGKVIFAGGNLERNPVASGSQDFRLARFAPTGIVDLDFGQAGFSTTAIGTSQDLAQSVELQSDGRIVSAGYSYNANTDFYDFAVVRYNTNGSLDTSFRSTGKVTTNFPGGAAYGRGLAIAPDGRIIVAGHAHNGANDDFALVRYFGTDQPPIVETGDATGIVRTGAVLNGTVNPNSLATTAYFEYGTTPGYGSTSSSVALGNGYLETPAVITIGGLTDNTLYHYRLVATNAAGTTYGEDRTFTTAPNPPLAFTGDASHITATGATLAGVALPNGRETTIHFEYGLTTAYGATTAPQIIPAETSLADVFAPVSGLVPGSTYHFRLVAINAGSPIPITGVDKTFLAQSPPPSVSLGGVVPHTTTGVRFSGTVNANNETTSVFFDYGTEANNLSTSIAASPGSVSGTLDTAVTAELTGLSQGVIYFYQLRAQNPGGTTTSTIASFRLELISGLTRVFPGALPEAQGFLIVNLSPSGPLFGWRFLGEQQWRPSGVPVGGLTSGDRRIEFRPVPGFIHPPEEPAVTIVSGAAATILDRSYFETEGIGGGGISVTLKPDSITTGPERGRWRLLGEDDSAWRDSGETLAALPPGGYLIECKPVAGRSTPSLNNVVVFENDTSTPTIIYAPESTATGAFPTALAFETVTADVAKPFAFVGQIRSNAGSGTGFAVKERVVATAAHVVWDEVALSAFGNMQWLHQRHGGTFEPKPITPRGFYLLSGYADMRQNEGTPGSFSPQSRNFDAAAIYFNTAAAREGYGGFLASDLDANEFLLSGANKMLVGYPIDGVATGSQGRMHATDPANLQFSPLGIAANRTFLTTGIRSSGGTSGGPLCVQFEGGDYYPAAIYLGGVEQTLVRAIDSAVIDLFNRAELSGIDDQPHLGGGITHTSVPGIGNPANPGSLKVNIQPPGAVAAGAGWRLRPETVYRSSGDQRSGLNAGRYVLQMATIPGYQSPAPQEVSVTGGVPTTLTYTYAPPPAPEIAVTGNGTGIADGDASPSPLNDTDFGEANVAGGSRSHIFTIANTGNAALSVGTVLVGGSHPGDFSVSIAPGGSVPPGGWTSFTVVFDPSADGTRSAMISFATNDTDENPFNFTIQGNALTDSNNNGFTDVEEAALNTLLSRFTVGQRVDLDLSFLRLQNGHALAITGLPPGLVYYPNSRRILGTITGKLPRGTSHLIRKMNGATELGSRAFNFPVFLPAKLVTSPTLLRFPLTTSGRRSAAKFLRLTNSGESVLQRLSVRVGGSTPNDFLLPVRPPATLNPGASATVSVVFRPLGKRTRTARLYFNSNAAPVSVPVSGTGR